jgi:integrase
MNELEQGAAAGEGWELATRLIKDGKVVRGRGDWLFLAHDSNDVMAQHCGERRLSTDELDRWRALVEHRARSLAKHGASYFFLVAPDTHAVYPEMLPESVRTAPERPVHQLAAALESSGSGAAMIYPLPELLAEKARNEVCSPVDTHWTDLGAFIAYERLMDEVERTVPVFRVPRDEVNFVTEELPGDLLYKLGIGRVTQQVGRVLPMATIWSDNWISGTGSIVITECTRAPETTCLLFGDSYSMHLLKYLAESFRRLVAARSTTIDYELVLRERPDVVVTEMAERSLVRVPDDASAPLLREVARMKRDRGEVRGVLGRWLWQPPPERERPPIISVGAIERARWALLAQDRLADAVLICAIAYGGMRPAEAVRLRWSDIGTSEIRVPGVRDAAGRTVRLLEPLAADLTALREGTPISDTLFPQVPPGERPAWLRWRDELFRPAARAAGIESPNPVALRHTFGKLLLDEGVPWPQVARSLGSEPSDMLRVYGGRLGTEHGGRTLSADEVVRANRPATARARVSER